MEFNRAQLKRSVKLSMKGTAPNPMLVTLLFSVVVSAGTGVLNGVLGFFLTGNAGSLSDMVVNNIQRGYEVEEAVEQAVLALLSQGPGNIFAAVVGGTVLSLIVALWQSAMNVGYEGYALSMVRGENPPMGMIFCALPQIGPVLVTRFLAGLFMLLWGLLVAVGYVALLFLGITVAAFTETVVIALPLILAAVVYLALGIIWVSVRYALVDFVLLDKGLSGLDAIRENKRLIKGNIGRLFVLNLSFIGWYLLEFAIVIGSLLIAVVAFGGPFLIDYINAERFAAAALGFSVVMVAAVIAVLILDLWLKPYVTGAMARFYDWARGGFGGIGGGERGWGQPTDYTWSSGPNSGAGIGPDFGSEGPKPNPPKPRDDPWN